MKVGKSLFGKAENDIDRESLRLIRARRIGYIITVAALTFILAGYSVTISSTDITPAQIYQTLFNQILPGTFDVPVRTQEIIMRVYAPRVMMALIVGAIFSIGGCITQTVLKNPLATPYTLGVSSSAAFGAGMSIILGVNVAIGLTGIIINALLFSLIPAAIILLATARRNMTATTMILIGISISYLFSAANTIMQYFGEADAVKSAMFWAVGDLNNAMIGQIPYVFLTLIVTIVASTIMIKDLDVMRMGDDTAMSLGVNVRRSRTLAIILACCSTAIAVSFVGAIGFICLLAPQISRIFVGNGIRHLLPASIFTGSLLLVVADIIAKDLIDPIILPVGAITALVGAPILIYLLLRNRNPLMG